MKAISKLMALFACVLLGAYAHAGWQQTFADEFDSLNGSTWQTTDFFDHDSNFTTGELDCYKSANATVSGGILSLTATATPPSPCATPPPQPLYSGAQITSASSFHQTYGYFEVRAKVPKGAGLWPQFRLDSLNSPLGPESGPQIFVTEFYGAATSAPVQRWDYSDLLQGRISVSNTFAAGADLSADFHRYGVDWQPGLLIYYIDGQEVYRSSDSRIYNSDMYMVLSLAVGGTPVGAPDSSTAFPASMQVDYVHVYARVDDGTPDDLPPAPPAPPPPSDTQAPKVAVLLPINGMTVKRGSVIILAAVANDNVKVTNTSFTINGQQVCALNRTFDICLWKVPTTKSVSSYSITANARDAAGNVGSASVTLKVK